DRSPGSACPRAAAPRRTAARPVPPFGALVSPCSSHRGGRAGGTRASSAHPSQLASKVAARAALCVARSLRVVDRRDGAPDRLTRLARMRDWLDLAPVGNREWDSFNPHDELTRLR